MVGGEIEPRLYGIAVRKDETELHNLLQQAVKQVVADGTYQRVLQRWDVAGGSLTTTQINGGSGPADSRST